MVHTDTLQSFEYLFDSVLIGSIAKVATLKTFKKDDIIIDIGQKLKFIPLLIKGNIKILREDKNGEELLIYVLESGDTCAMSLTCCMSKSSSKIRAVADEDTEVIMIPIENMQLWFHTNESWRNFILESYQIRFDEMLETIDTLAFMRMDERLFKYLTDKVKLTASTQLDITHQDIAEDLHTSRVVISRLLKQLEKEGKIELGRNKIDVLEF
ncbi:Crp/Fnr family transcriptional regulator [Winogradskyella jejuensis]|uniref:CRP/FNR family transcriptional regulator, anaerobic regulatory protein n=1 Tax=Winogradskyella jejuensis TaxID=1089305 RepID=A0A1M5S198_9FLAO|nr:Crp/Fnr family transcriptional regulator [Winogradskyella jejuensis]SHH32098.1 CRP/FNR family transcriptional regulator, anaerobic regulatory protein [Winogradskyella jejuensis]